MRQALTYIMLSLFLKNTSLQLQLPLQSCQSRPQRPERSRLYHPPKHLVSATRRIPDNTMLTFPPIMSLTLVAHARASIPFSFKLGGT
jgi:hypothetical protein